jgi:hypothetical protein
LGFPWLWSIVIGLAVLLVIGLVVELPRVARSYFLEAGPTWALGNLPPLELRSRVASGRGTWRASGRDGGSMPQPPRDGLAVHINGQAFSLGDRFQIDKLFPANFGEGGSVDRVRAGALPHQTMLVAKHCVAKAFGGEFAVAPLMRGKGPSPAMADTTAFLFFAKPDPAGPLEPSGLERITIVMAGGGLALTTVTRHFAALASEMFGEPLVRPRGQRIWKAGDVFLLCDEEEWKGLRRTTFVWTRESLDI